MKWITVICSAVLLLVNIQANSTSASYVGELDTDDAVITSVGLIVGYDLSVSNKNGQLCINGTTSADTTMQKIGFTDIVVERSSNGSTGWTSAYTLNDVLNSDALSCKFNNMLVSVTGGYYYRVSCNHYAKETGWFFPRSQSVGNISNAVYIS